MVAETSVMWKVTETSREREGKHHTNMTSGRNESGIILCDGNATDSNEKKENEMTVEMT